MPEPFAPHALDAPRIGLVLGAGGATGGAFHAGLLAALAESTGWDAREAAIVVGTSAGSLTGAMLRAGFAPRDLLCRARGEPLSRAGAELVARLGPAMTPPRLSLGWDAASGPIRPADARALLSAALRPWRVRPGAVMASALPEGRTPVQPIAKMLAPLFRDGWPKRPFRACAVRLRDARRKVFGRSADETAPVGSAVAASCAIPGVFAPMEIYGERYADGGAHSPTNADVLRRDALDLVLVSSPMSADPRGRATGADVVMRRMSHLLLRREMRSLRRRGIPVVAFEPSADDVEVMGWDAMDPSRRGPVAQRVLETTLQRLEDPRLRERLAPLAGTASSA